MQSLVDISAARPSSTVVLAREAADAPEIFMVRRHEDLSFGTAYAFPGGVVDPDDADVHPFCTGLSAEDADSRLGVQGNGLDYYSAAVRELFEESGVLLADTASLDENLATVRAGLNDDSDNWADFVHRSELQIDCPHGPPPTATPGSSGRASRRGSCASSAAAPAASCGTRRGPCAHAATRLRGTASSPAAAARSTASSFTTTRRCTASRHRSRSRSWSSRRERASWAT